MTWKPIAKVTVALLVGLAAVGLSAVAAANGIDVRGPVAVLVGVLVTTATAYMTPDPRVDQDAKRHERR